MKKIILALIAILGISMSNNIYAQRGDCDVSIYGGHKQGFAVGYMSTDKVYIGIDYAWMYNATTSGEQARPVADGRNELPLSAFSLDFKWNSSYDEIFNFSFGGGPAWIWVTRDSYSRYGYGYNDYDYGYNSYSYDYTPSCFSLKATAQLSCRFLPSWSAFVQADAYYMFGIRDVFDAGIIKASEGSPVQVSAGVKLSF